ncbi:hypothetical protein NLG97_g5434 [Lecanicillium saksenae]|uniref:Uncharacterized protein n=1 Tax=Lecanicillium saksenae TaxID=468837 RepID=A0ACC1QWA6_9HYPO|nr:hypothetical protein NLG97_g5434 [Lecanicillium saksenae]
MDDLEWTWPAWKFGLKMDDQFKQLQEAYNTIPSAIQNPQAFHLDLLEIATKATTKEELYKELAIRKQKRILELNRSLESLSCEIVANPNLLAVSQWQHAVQIFRTGSLDSLVEYFASYLTEIDPGVITDIPAPE